MKNKILGIIIFVIIIGGIYFWIKPWATNVKNVEQVKDTQVIELKDHDVYNLSVGYVSKMISGKEQVMLAYNGSIPGPTIRVAQGSEITVDFKNNTDMPQLLHSHGVRMDNAFDGSQTVQKEIQPDESFAYKLKFPDAGIYWYHPHAGEVYGQGLGLYGAFIVTPTDGAYFSKVNQDVALFLSDLPIENGKITLEKNKVSHSLMGHYGNTMMINGEENYNLKLKQGEVARFYVVNASNARPYNFAIDGLKMKLVGADSGAYEKESFVDAVVLGPSERAIVDVFMPKSGIYTIQNKTPDTTYTLGLITVSSEKADTSYEKEWSILQTNTATVKSIDPFRKYFGVVPDKNIALTLDMGGNMVNMKDMGHGGHMMPDGTMMGGSMMSASLDGIEWDDTNQMMNAMSNPDSIKWKIKDTDTGKENMDIDWTFKKDQPVKIRIFNDPKSMHPMQHPIHFHGQRFLVVARNGVQQTNLVWKDTTLVKSGETVDIILDPSNVGTWMAHCHISEHLEAGMMFSFSVK
ncbi:MAG: multicopper oxidase family protein [Minisyncoccia bacterium]